MIRIGIYRNREIYNNLLNILRIHYVPFIEHDNSKISDVKNPKDNSIHIYYINDLNDIYIMKQNFKNSICFNAILLQDTELFSVLETYSKVLILFNSNEQYFTAQNTKIITFGFNNLSNVTYSSIMEKNKNTQLEVCVQSEFKTLYNTKMIKFEFTLLTNLIESQTLLNLLSLITLCLYLDIRFAKKEYINYEKENFYVK